MKRTNNPFVIQNTVKKVINAKRNGGGKLPGRDFINLSNLGPQKAMVMHDGDSDILSFKQTYIDIYTEDNGRPRQLIPAGLHRLRGSITDCVWDSINYSPDENFLWNLFLNKDLDTNLSLIYNRLFKLHPNKGKYLRRNRDPLVHTETIDSGLGMLNVRERAEVDTSLKEICNSGSAIFSAREVGMLLNDLDENEHGRFVLLFNRGPQVFGVSFYIREF